MNKNKLVLKASAGTGKTFRLSLEYIVALLNGMDYKNILVMTFTKKATAEIKKEVLDKICDFTKIYEILKEKKQDIEAIREYLKTEKEKYFLIIKVIEDLYGKKITENELKKLSIIYSEILKNKEKIKIYTIDSFLNIIFKNIVVNFLNIKTYTMIDDDENIYYYKKILENIFRDKDLFRRFKDFFIDNSEKSVDKYLEIIANLINGRWKYLISLSENENFYSKEKLTIEKPSYEYLKDICIYIQDEAKKELEDSLKKDYKKYLNKSDDVLRKILFLDFKNILDNEPYNGNKFRKKEDAVHKEEIKNIYEKLKINLSKEIYNEILIPYEKKLMELSGEIYKIYDELKIRERKFTFNDISLYTYRTLFNNENKLIDTDGLTENFYESLDMQIDTIFIDEFQDTSILQWKILHEIIKKAKSVICVGDEKQSIYGWRGGEKKLFENLEKIIDATDENMDISYRSDINIVEFTNKIFNKIKEKTPNWRFNESTANSKEKGYVKLNYVEKSKDEKIDAVQILIEELEKTELKNYSDIAIIARTNKELKEIAEALEEKKIPYHLSTKRNIEDSRGIFEYLELLKYLIYDRKLSLFNF
ncbi:UvrD-helicase domain-containing protein, partial [Fusobacterium sp.]|uniref:UvrD-helicase domain-containing protein n=1 Tax=Fusobacterium sp. TaxID=68766 RepID=UPI0025B8DD8D